MQTSYEAGTETLNSAISSALTNWTGALTIDLNTDSVAVAASERAWQNAGASNMATDVNASVTADQTFFDAIWAAWNQVNQSLIGADQTQVTDVGQASQTLATQLLSAQTTFVNSMATARSAYAVAEASAEYTFRVAQARINNSRAVDAAHAQLSTIQNRDVSLFTSPYATGDGPGTNQGTSYADNSIWTQIAGALDFLSGGTSTNILASPQFGTALNAVDGFFAGMADALTAGLSTRVRAAMWGQSATQNHQGDYFNAGQITGTVVSMALGFGSPCGLATASQVGYRGLQAIQGVGGVINAAENLADGKPLAAALDAFGVMGNVASFLKACFVAGTPIRTPEGSKAIEELKIGDLVLAKDEYNPEGPVTAKAVLQTFVRTSPTLNVHARGFVIGTTAEHPFFVRGKGWVEAHYLEKGDEFQTSDGRRVPCDGIADSGRIETVYNVEVADSHTYFVGERGWGWDLWVHNYLAGSVRDLINKLSVDGSVPRLMSQLLSNSMNMWKGGYYQASRVLAYGPKVKAVEFRLPGGGFGDILLTNGTAIEAKAWAAWNAPSS